MTGTGPSSNRRTLMLGHCRGPADRLRSQCTTSHRRLTWFLRHTERKTIQGCCRGRNDRLHSLRIPWYHWGQTAQVHSPHTRWQGLSLHQQYQRHTRCKPCGRVQRSGPPRSPGRSSQHCYRGRPYQQHTVGTQPYHLTESLCTCRRDTGMILHRKVLQDHCPHQHIHRGKQYSRRLKTNLQVRKNLLGTQCTEYLGRCLHRSHQLGTARKPLHQMPCTSRMGTAGKTSAPQSSCTVHWSTTGSSLSSY